MNNQTTPVMQFLGATGTVTGSKTAVFVDSMSRNRLMVDCGLFQGPKALRLRNRESFPVDPRSIGSILLTHGHLDHCGYLPRMVRNGFSGPVYCTEATAEIARIILLDSARLQEEEAEYANKKGFSRHKPALPLYTTEDATRAIDLFRTVYLKTPLQIGRFIEASFFEAGHILGSTSIQVSIKDHGSILFSGDIGRYGAPILPDPADGYDVDWVIMESTYGDRLHSNQDVFTALAQVINDSIERGGILVIPAFAVGRTQLVLFAIRQLQAEKTIPSIPVYIDSPMAIKVTGMHMRHSGSFDMESKYMMDEGMKPIVPENLNVQISVEESKFLNSIKSKAIIISASGMATGGRILHHLANRLPHRENTILFIGYQAEGTRGRTLLNGESRVKIHGKMVPVNADIRMIDGFSAHADQDELLIWLKKFNRTPSRVFLNHGEDIPIDHLRTLIERHFKTQVTVPEYLEKFPVTSSSE